MGGAMSSVTISGDTSGSIILQAPAVSGSTTLTLPTTTGTVALTSQLPVAGPTFSAFRSTSNQSFSSNTWTKVQCQTEEWDTNSNYDNSTNYRFTPTVAGYYQCSAAWSNDTSSSYNYVSIYKNGVSSRLGIFNGANGVGATISAIIYLNGSTDFIEMYIFSNTGNIQTGAGSTFFQAALIRSA
jgi:hypothetical protein